MTSLGKKELVIKHDDIVRLGREFGGLKESRFLNCCLVNNSWKERYNETVYYPVNLNRYAEKGGLPYHRAYTECKEIVTKYAQQLIEVTLDNGAVWHTHLIYDFISDDETKTLTIRWNKDIIPLVSGKVEAGKHAYYDARMDSVANTRIYHLSELIQRNLFHIDKFKRKFMVLTTAEIREVTGTLNCYTEYKELNRWVIQPTIKEMSNILGYDLAAKGSKREVKFYRVEH
jgi:plasmid replication initiation protein